MTEKLTAKDYLQRIRIAFIHMKEILLERFTNDNSTIMTNHSELRENVYRFNHSKATTRDKVEVNKYVRINIQEFIQSYVKAKLTPLDKLSKDPHQFVKTLNEVWTHYQIFIFCHYFACEKLSEFFTSFHRMNNVKDYQYLIGKSPERQEIVPIPTMGVNELKRYFEEIGMINRFKSIFNQFLLYEREGKNVPRSEIRESVHSLESCYFDMDAYSELQDQKPRLIKKEFKNDKLSINRRSKDGEFFQEHLLEQTLENLGKFYANFVDQKALVMNSTDQIRKIIEIIIQEEARANYYIHSKENRSTYVNILNLNLIVRDLEKRIMKEDGLKKYLDLYEQGKEEYERELKDFWRVYSRVIEVSLPFVKDLFVKYLFLEAEKVCQKIRIPPEFIQELIRINSKCIKIVDICDNNFELETERNVKIRDMITNCITERGKKEAKFDTGAKNLASFMNNKFKTSYSKGGMEALGDSYRQLVALFKIMLEKTRFIDEYHRHLGNRMLEDVQFSKDLETGQILTMEKQFIEEIQKECGVSDVRELTEVIKDIEKSNQNNNKLKSKIPADQLFPLNQLIIKNANNWPERNTYNVENPPRQILRCYNAVSEYFKRDNTNIQFQFNSGVSTFRGDYENGKKQNFQFKNIYMLILLYIDEERKMFYGDLKKKIESVGTNKQRGQIDFAKAVIELYYSGFITSSTKSIKPGTPNICKISETDEFELNRKFDFVEEEKRKKGGRGPPPKPVPILKSNILTLSEELKKGFDEETKAYNDDEKKIEAERKYKVECITVKTLKHAHHHNMNCSFEQLYKVTQDGKNKEFRVTEKFLKEIVEELIIKRYCERIEGQRNVFRYIA